MPAILRPRSFHRHVVLGAILYALILAFPVLSPIVLSFLLTIIVAFALHPLVAWLRARSGKKSIALAIFVGCAMGIAGLAIWIFHVPLKHSGALISEHVPKYLDRVQRPLLKLEHQADIAEEKLKREVATEVAKERAQNGEHPVATDPAPGLSVSATPPTNVIQSGLRELLNALSGSFKHVVSNTATLLFVLVIVCFGVVLTLMYPRQCIASLLALVPASHHPVAVRIIGRTAQTLPHWAMGTLLAMVSVGLLVFLLMWPIFGLADAVILGLCAFLLEIIPCFGPTLSAVPALLLALGAGEWTPLWVVSAYLLVHALENFVIQPLIQSSQLRLHPMVVLFAMLISVAAFGVLGVLLAAPAVAVATILRDELYRPRFLPEVSDKDLDQLAADALDRPNARHQRPTVDSEVGADSERYVAASLK